MTALSTLYPVPGGANPYLSGVPLVGPIPNAIAANGAVNYDYLLPFVPRTDVTVDKLWWYRTAATAGNIYMGLVDASGNRLDDCAVDSDTTTGVHEIDSTNFALTAGSWYGIILNQSANVAAVDVMSSTDEDISSQSAYNYAHPIDLGLFTGGTFPVLGHRFITARKSRTNAAVADPTTMTGWESLGHLPFIGIVPA